MALAYDRDGFLTGEPLEIDVASYEKHLAILREIRADGAAVRSDISAIRKSLEGPSPSPVPITVTPNISVVLPGIPQPRPVVSPSRAADESGDSSRTLPEQNRVGASSASPSSPSAPAMSPAPAMPSSPAPAAIAPPVKAPKIPQARQAMAVPRQSNGRFASRAERGIPESPKDSSDSKSSSAALKDAASDLSRSAGEMLAGTEQVDPTLSAAKEVKDILTPAAAVFKPIGRLFGRGDKGDAEKAADKSVPWYRKMWFELRDINKKSDRSSGGIIAAIAAGIASIVAILMRFTGIAALARMLGRGAGLSGVFGRRGPAVGGGSGRAPGRGRRTEPVGRGRAGRFGGAAKGIARKLPLIGGLVAGGSALYSMFGGGDQTRQERFEGAGSGIGAIVGGIAGSLAGPMGTVVGAAIGDMVGEKVGSWLSTVDWSAVADGMAKRWDSVASWTMNAASGAFGAVRDGWASLAAKGSKVFDNVSDWFGQKLGTAKAAIASGVKAARTTRDNAYDAISAKGSSIADAARNVATKATFGLYKGGSDANKDALVSEMNAAGIKDPKEQAMFMAQMDHESGGFKSYEENLNYSAGNLRKTFGKYYKTDAEAMADARNPEAIANKVYGGRMGNVDPGDGYKFRGRGAIQLTGRANYERAGKALGIDLVSNPDLAKDPATAARIATWYWKDRNTGAAGRAGDVLTATRKINGGTNGLDDRKAKYAEYLEQAKSGSLTKQTADQTRAAPPAAVSQAIARASQPLRRGSSVSVVPMAMPAATAVPSAAARPVSLPSMPRAVSVTARPMSYTPAAPDLMRFAPKDAPPKVTPVASNQKQGSQPLQIQVPLARDVADRNIASVAAGGIGMAPMRN